MKKIKIYILLMCLFSTQIFINAQTIPDPDQGLRVEWMRGAWAALWLPETTYNGKVERVSIEPFLEQIKDIRTIDYVQVGLTNPNIYSPVHTAPHDIIESLWQEDYDANGDPINLVVPRASAPDPFLSWLQAIKAEGLKTEIYVNSYNLLAREPDGIPDGYPDLSQRWMDYCDTDPTVQAFINTHPYLSDGDADERKYMLCYAEFILKEYAVRYGDLIDAWCFDSADNIMSGVCGDDPESEDVNHLRIYQAFADACHAGNPNAGIAFNNSVGDRVENPFSAATYFDDYTFGHPFGGAGNMVEPRDPLYTYNYHVIEWMDDYNGDAFTVEAIDEAGDLMVDRAWNNNVVSHFFPKQSTTSWNAGSTACLTDAEFVEWTTKGIIDGGAITWGTPLVQPNLALGAGLTLQAYALTQLALTDDYLKVNQAPGAPNWSRQTTILPAVYPGQTYMHDLVEGIDLWDPEAAGVTGLTIVGAKPAWLTITETATEIGSKTWTLSGTPTETEDTEYTFEFSATDADGTTNREVRLQVMAHPASFTNPGDGTPVWASNSTVLANGMEDVEFEHYLIPGEDFYDFEGDVLTITKTVGADWLTVSEIADGVWYLSGTPTESDLGLNTFTLNLSDGVLASTTEIQITVDESPTTDITALIQATAGTNYGVDVVATMVSDIQTAYDDLATFKISIDVTPTAGTAIQSGDSNGSSDAYSWGVGTGAEVEVISDYIFDPVFTYDVDGTTLLSEEQQWVESIANIQIIEFNANGGALTEDQISAVFKSVIIQNGQSSGKDYISIKVKDVLTGIGNMLTNPETVHIDDQSGVENVTSFAIGTGTTGAKNKWSIGGINVLVTFADDALSLEDDLQDDSLLFKIFPNPAREGISLNIPIHSVSIFDITGRVVKMYTQETSRLDISELATGVYFLKGISPEGKTLVKKFVKSGMY